VEQPKPYFRWLHRLSVIGLVFTVALTIGIGGTITSAEVGMAYPTWPDINGNSLFSMFYGQLADTFGLGSMFEHTHRQAASLTGLFILLLAGASLLTKGVPKQLRILSVSTLVIVIAQGLLGASRVLDNAYLVAILHAVGAQVVVLLLVALAKQTAQDWHRPVQRFDTEAVRRLRLWSVIALVLLFINLFTAASLRHKQGAFEGHLILAITTGGVILYLIRQTLTIFREQKRMTQLARSLAHILGTQLALGATAWAFLLGPLVGSFPDENTRMLIQSLIATGHLLCGVLVLAVTTSLWMEARFRIDGGGRA
jgi:hypothetical protein